MSVHNPINIFLINPNIILYCVLFIKYLWISKISLVSIGLKSKEEKFTTPFNPVFQIINKKQITNKKLMLPLYCRFNTNIFPDCVKLI